MIWGLLLLSCCLFGSQGGLFCLCLKGTYFLRFLLLNLAPFIWIFFCLLLSNDQGSLPSNFYSTTLWTLFYYAWYHRRRRIFSRLPLRSPPQKMLCRSSRLLCLSLPWFQGQASLSSHFTMVLSLCWLDFLWRNLQCWWRLGRTKLVLFPK